MKKIKGKRLLSLLLTLCMVLSLVPAAALAAKVDNAADAVVGDTITTTTKDVPNATEPAYWKLTDKERVCDSAIEHTHNEDCYYQSCDHKEGHLSTCYGEEYTYELCEHSSADEHTGSVTLEDVITFTGTDVKWKTDHPAYPVVHEVYDDAYEDVSDEDCTKAYDTAYAAAIDVAYDLAYGAEYTKVLMQTWSKDKATAAAKVAGEAAAKSADTVNAAKAAGDAAVKAICVAAGWDAVNGEEFCYTAGPSATPDKCTHECSEVGGDCYTKICILSEHTHVDECFASYTWTLCSDAKAEITVESIASVKVNGVDADKDAIIAAVKDATSVEPKGATATYTAADYTTPAVGETAEANVTITVAATSTTKETTKTVTVEIYSELQKNSVTVASADNGIVTVTNGADETAEGATGQYAETNLTVVAKPDKDYYVASVTVNGTSILDKVTDAAFTGTFEVVGATTVTATFAAKEATEIVLNDADITATYGKVDEKELLNQLVAGVRCEESVEDYIADADDVEISIRSKNAGEQNVTLKYKGDATHLPSEKTATVTIEKAPVSVNVNDVTVRYGEGYNLAVTAKDETGKDVTMISFVAGLDMEDMQIVNGEVTFPETVVNLKLPKVLGFDIPSTTVSLETALKLLEGYNLGSEMTSEQMDQLIAALKELEAKFGEVTVMINGDMPKNIGVYLVGAVTADANYETAMDVGALVITPDGHRAELDWNIYDENGAIALTAIDSYDLAAHVAKLYEIPSGMTEEEAIAAATNEIEHLFIGMNLNGEIVLTQDLKTENSLTGAYAEVASIVNWGNEMFYSMPIVRTLVVVPELVDVKFVDANENNARRFTYTGEPCEMEVLVEGNLTEPGNNLTVVYTGVTVDGETYYSEDAPSKVGAYTATALYAEKKNGEVVKAGIAIGAMVIEKAASGFAMYDETATYDAQSHFVNVEGDEATAVLYAVVNRDTNTVNVIIPDALKALVPELAQSGSVDITVAKDEIETLIAKVKAVELPEGFEIPEGFVTELNKVLSEVEAVLAEVPNATVVINGDKPVDAGVYEVYAVTYSKIMKSAYANAVLTINPCTATITVADAEVVVGEDAPQFTYAVSGIVDGYDPAVMLNCEYDKAVATSGQEYAINATYTANSNYVVTVVPGKLKVKESPVVTVPVMGVTLDKTSATIDLKYGNTTSLVATVSPAGATNKAVTWISSNPSVATVDENGVVTAITTGTATITATTDDGNYTAECVVTVTKSSNVRPSGGSGGGGSTKYAITVEDTDNGSVESSHAKASKGTTVTITVDPEAGYEVDDIVVETKAGKAVEVTDKGEGKFTFKMPAANVIVSVDFEKAAASDDVQAEEEYILLTIDSVIAWVFDEYVANDVAPVIRNERTMLPARFVAEALGGVVTWNEAEQKVTIVKGEDTIEIFIGEPFATVNGTPVELDSPAFIENSRTYLPIRFIAENMGATVTWNAAEKTVKIVPGK